MKKGIILFSALFMSVLAFAQIKIPQPSPHAKIEQTVGLTEIEIEYSRPSMRGRKIFGGLLPYGKRWRTGANENTKISFSTPVTIDGEQLEAGDYSLYTVPNENQWRVIFYENTENWGLPETWEKDKIALSTMVEAHKLKDEVETLTISIDNLTFTKSHLNIMWEKTKISIPFSVPTDKMVSSNIKRVMEGPVSRDYYNAAVYYLEADKDIEKAKKWIDKAIEMSDDPKFFQMRQKALIYEKSGDRKGAIKAAKKSMELAKEAGNDDYVRMNKESLEEWGAM